ncbi:hypothetical protein [Daejeonella sp.]|uniref:hypothetical protein n=1 Tax=Daejeonella sp. TaxID=2805397 RepID=UPI0030C04DEE
MKLKTSVFPFLAENEYLPSALVTADVLLSFRRTETPGNTSPSSAAVIFPLIITCWEYEMLRQTGFESVFYFSKLFKKKNGISPKFYRSAVED